MDELSEIGTLVGYVQPANTALAGRLLFYEITSRAIGGYNPFRVADDGALVVSGPLDFELHQGPNGIHYPLDVLLTADADPILNLPAYQETIHATITITNNSQDNVMSEGSAFGHAWEGGKLQLFIGPQIRAGVFTKYEVDLNMDGVYDATLGPAQQFYTGDSYLIFPSNGDAKYNSNVNGAIFQDLDMLSLLNPSGPVSPGTYTAHYRATSRIGYSLASLIFENDFSIRVDNVPGQPLVTSQLPGGIPLPGFGDGQRFYFEMPTTASAFQPISMTIRANSTSATAVNGLRIDWGDGTPTTPVTGNQATVTHTYETVGSPVVRIVADDAPDFIIDERTVDVTDPRPVVVSILGQMSNQYGDGFFVANAIDANGNAIIDPNCYVWDLDGDNVYDVVGKSVAILPNADWLGAYVASGSDLIYRAKLIVSDVQGRIRQAEFVYQADNAFVGGGQTVFSDIDFDQENLPQVVNNGDYDFDPDLMLEIVKNVRPDVYAYWTGSNSRGIVELINTTDWFLHSWYPSGWFWWNRANSMVTTSGRTYYYIRRDHNLSEMAVAQEIIRAVESGYFAADFKVDKALRGIDDFDNAEQMARYWKWWRQQAGSTTAQGARALLDLYSIGFKGTDLILTAQDIADGNISYFNLIDAVQLFPFFGKLRGAIEIVDHSGTVVKKVPYDVALEMSANSSFYKNLGTLADKPFATIANSIADLSAAEAKFSAQLKVAGSADPGITVVRLNAGQVYTRANNTTEVLDGLVMGRIIPEDKVMLIRNDANAVIADHEFLHATYSYAMGIWGVRNTNAPEAYLQEVFCYAQSMRLARTDKPNATKLILDGLAEKQTENATKLAAWFRMNADQLDQYRATLIKLGQSIGWDKFRKTLLVAAAKEADRDTLDALVKALQGGN